MGMWKMIAGTLLLIAAAVGLGLYVFPERPWIGWALLFFCWACYRLKMRADRLFRPRPGDSGTTDTFPESGSKGGARYAATDPAGSSTLNRYYEWRASGGDPAEPRHRRTR